MSYKSKVAFIVGNGVTRKQIDLETLVGKAPIYGCNALYRDFSGWDFLVAFDRGMVKEISTVNPSDGIVIIPPEEKHWENPAYSPNRRRNNAGMVAMDEAIDRGASILYCLGFDFLIEGSISTDNVYKNTQNYGAETHATQNDNYYRIKYLEWFANYHPEVKFVFVVPEGTALRRIDADNVVMMTMDVFKNKVSD
jgi:hypothetical protein